jgi:FkbM family methyltransferase
MNATASLLDTWMPNWRRAARAVLPQWVNNWREAQYYLRYGEIELHFLKFLCSRDKDSIDVGAHDGCYVHFLRHYSRHVFAYEPIPWLAAGLRRKFPHGVTVIAAALSRSDGTATLHVPIVGGQLVSGCSTMSDTAASSYGESRDIAVPVHKLDDVHVGDVGFIKIDVEGHEQAVLEGARETIARCRPYLVVEVMERLAPGGVRRVAQFFARHGYEGFFLYRWELLPVERFDAAVAQRDEDCPDLVASLKSRERPPRFAVNFIYLPGERSQVVLPRLEEELASLRRQSTAPAAAIADSSRAAMADPSN